MVLRIPCFPRGEARHDPHRHHGLPLQAPASRRENPYFACTQTPFRMRTMSLWPAIAEGIALPTDKRFFAVVHSAAWQRDYNEVRPHLAHKGRTPASLRLPSCSPASRPLRAGFAGGPRPVLVLTQATGDGVEPAGRPTLSPWRTIKVELLAG